MVYIIKTLHLEAFLLSVGCCLPALAWFMRTNVPRGLAALRAAVNCPSDVNCGIRRVNYGLRQMNCAPRIAIWLMNVKNLYRRGGRPRPPAAPSARSAFRNCLTASHNPVANSRDVRWPSPTNKLVFPAQPYKCTATTSLPWSIQMPACGTSGGRPLQTNFFSAASI